MISLPLLKKEMKSGWKMLVIFLAVVAMYTTIIVGMFDPNLGESLNMMAESMPQLFEAFGMSNPGTTMLEFVANYLYGFILIVFPLIYILLTCNRLIVRYVDRGSMVSLLATPNTRGRIIRTQLFGLVGGITILVAFATVLIVLTSYLFFDEGIDIPYLLLLNAGLWCLHIFFGGLAFLSACLFNETKLETGVAAGISILFILIDMLSQVGDKIDWLEYATPLTLFSTDLLITGDEEGIIRIGVLFVCGIVMMLAGGIIFKRKDLSI